MKVAPILAIRRLWCVRCGAITDANLLSCMCRHTGEKPYFFPPDVEIHGNVELGENVSICGPTDINGVDSSVVIGEGCDIAAFVTINCADSSRRCMGTGEMEREPITIESNVFIGQGATILGGCFIGHHSKVAAGVVLKGRRVPPWSLVKQFEQFVLPGYYEGRG